MTKKIYLETLKSVLGLSILHYFSKLFKTLTKTLLKEFVAQQSSSLLTESFIRGRSRYPATYDMKFF